MPEDVDRLPHNRKIFGTDGLNDRCRNKRIMRTNIVIPHAAVDIYLPAAALVVERREAVTSERQPSVDFRGLY